jgi:hypothetical protein
MRASLRSAVPWFGLFVVCSGIALVVIRPFYAADVGFDTAASVLHFDRIVGGRHLEAFVTTTPKPLLTIIDGTLYRLTGDWRPLVWVSILSYAGAIAGAARLAHRIVGPRAAAFVAVALLGSGALLEDTAMAYAASWAFLAWVVAGLAISEPRPRYVLAGFALGLGTLARIETLLITVVAAIVIGLWWLRRRSSRDGFDPASAGILVGVAALPIMFVHDWLLTGDPLFWTHVSSAFSTSAAAAVAIQTPLHMVLWIGRHVLDLGFLGPLALLGAASLLWRRRDGTVLGATTIGLGTACFLVLLSVRGIYVSARYVTPIDLALRFCAGIGFAELGLPRLAAELQTGAGTVTSRFLGRFAPAHVGANVGAATAVLVAGLSAALIAPQFGPVDGSTRAIIGTGVTVAADADTILPTVRRGLGAIPDALAVSPRGATLQPADPSRIVISVPALLRPRLAVDLGVALDRIAGLVPRDLTAASLALTPGRLIVHIRAAESSPADFVVLESSTPVPIGDVTLMPLVANPPRGVWVLQVAKPAP